MSLTTVYWFEISRYDGVRLHKIGTVILIKPLVPSNFSFLSQIPMHIFEILQNI